MIYMKCGQNSSDESIFLPFSWICEDGKLRLWDVATSELLQEVEAHADCLKCLSVGPGDTWITVRGLV